MNVTIKITDDKTWTDEVPLEFEIEEARKLYQKLHQIFGDGRILVYPVSNNIHAKLDGITFEEDPV